MTWDDVRRACSKAVGPCPVCGSNEMKISLKIARPDPGCSCENHWGVIGFYCCHGVTSIKESEEMGYTKDNREYFDQYDFAFGKVAPPEQELMAMTIKAATEQGRVRVGTDCDEELSPDKQKD